ncbi:MAG: MgtC/SapB family protein, partial [Aestuariivirgaceae bacterium]
LLITGAFAVVGYFVTYRSWPESVGLTTEFAIIVVFLLGAMIMLGYRELAIGLGVVTAAVLAYKQPLHGFVSKLDWDDVFAGLRLLIATFIALPLLPNNPIDPWGALNPYSLWLLVILISGLSLVGYVATRWLGPGKGAAITGLTGGLVSSTAVTLSFAKEARNHPKMADALAGGILLAWATMFARILVEVAVVNRDLLLHIFAPFLAMGLVVGGAAALLYRRNKLTDSSSAKRNLNVRNPFSLTAAARFALYFAVVLLIVKIAQQNFPANSMYVVAALAGLTDVDAITLSMAEFAKAGETRVATFAIVIAALSNTLVKCGMALAVAGLSLAKPLLITTAAMLLVGLAAALIL